MIPLTLSIYDNKLADWVTKQLWEIFEPSQSYAGWSTERLYKFAYDHKMFPTEVKLTSEAYVRDSDRTANYELEKIKIVNAKAKPEFTWSLIKASYVERLLEFLKFHYNYKDENGIIQYEDAPRIGVQYKDFVGMRFIEAYLGQTIEGTMVEYDNEVYWENFRLAFPER